MAMLQGFTVLDLASVGPAARASRILADYGMNVIKIAPVTSAAAKQVDPVFYAYGAGRGMQKIRLDLKSEEGREAIYGLAKSADVLIESYRPGVADRLGVGYDAIKAQNPLIVYCSTSGYGQDGPWAQWAGHDINYLAVGGFLGCSGRDDKDRPAMPGATVADSAGGGMHAALAIFSALLNRSRSEEGCYLDVAVTDGVLNLMSLYIDQYLATGINTGPGSDLLTGRYAWYGIYKTADERAISVGAIEPHFYQNLCKLLELEEFSDCQFDADRQEEMKAAFQDKFLTRSRDDWTALLASQNTCVAPVLDIAEVVEIEHLQSRHSFMQANHPEQGKFKQLGPVLAGGERNQPTHQVRPSDVTDADAILRSAGFSEEDVERLKRSGKVE